HLPQNTARIRRRTDHSQRQTLATRRFQTLRNRPANNTSPVIALVTFSRLVNLRAMIRKSVLPIALFVVVLQLSLISSASAKQLTNLDSGGVAIQGYDPVAFFTDHMPVKGSQNFQSGYNGANYYFASAEHKALFDKEPAKYEPQFGGFCAYGASR